MKINRMVLGLLGAILLVVANGCKHTAHGFGEDVERSGEKIQEKTR